MTANDTQVLHGTAAWFTMVGRLMMDAARQAQLPGDANVSLVERYSDGADLADGLVQGLRFAVTAGTPSFRYGVYPDERGDVTIEVTMAASRKLNTLYGDDPRFRAALASLQANRALRVTGELAGLGDWFGAVHDQIVARTRQADGGFSATAPRA